MKESYTDDIMLCFVQGFGDGDRSYKPRELTDGEGPSVPSVPSRLSKKRQQKKLTVQVDNIEQAVEQRRPIIADVIEESVEFRSRGDLVMGKSLKLSSGEKLMHRLPEVKRSLSDRFSVVTDSSGKKPSKGLLTIRKTWYVHLIVNRITLGNYTHDETGCDCK
ncbi:hypothetical protein O0L34_g15644 [Tuta absoluta]|nr:hypothetical protein O0L34_g15644 [Tuta absoluta]